MVAAAAVRASARGVTAKAAVEGGCLDALVEFERRIERGAGCAIGDELDGLEQAAAPDIADMPVIAEAVGEPPLELSTEILDAIEQLLVIDHPLDLERSRAS